MEMNVACKIVPLSFHRNWYAAAESSCGINWYPFFCIDVSLEIEIENTNTIGKIHNADNKNDIKKHIRAFFNLIKFFFFS